MMVCPTLVYHHLPSAREPSLESWISNPPSRSFPVCVHSPSHRPSVEEVVAMRLFCHVYVPLPSRSSVAVYVRSSSLISHSPVRSTVPALAVEATVRMANSHGV